MKNFKEILNTKHYINGKFVEGRGESFIIKNKYTGANIIELPLADTAQMEETISASVHAFDAYRNTSAGKRKEYLLKIKKLLSEQADYFATLIVAEAGKPIEYARTEVERALLTLTTAAEETIRAGGEYIPMDFSAGEGKSSYVKRFPVGPVAAISPFNFPLNLAMHKIAPALAAGCSIILKPPHQAPLTCLAFAKIVHEAGLPPGVVNMLLCNTDVAEIMVRDERLKLLSFTGSDKVGWHLKNIAGRKKVLLELGGNAAVLVDDTVEPEKIASLIVKGTYNYAGQVCISTQRIYVLESNYEKLKNLLIEEISKINSGDPAEENVINGPLIDNDHLHRIDDWVKEAANHGALLLAGGKILDEKHNLYAPTLLTNTNNKMKIISEEAFGPVASVEKISSFEEGLDKINNSKFGLQAGIFTNRIDRMKEAFNQLEVGGVIINNVPAFRIDTMPYGGVKNSGLGREGVKYAIEEMTEPRLIVF